MTKSAVGQRGKSAEKAVEAVLKKFNERAGFAYHRFPDARSARGALTAQPGDFLYFAHPYAGVIEVKETQHSFRIAKDKVSQLPTLKKFEMAGARSVIVIHHSTDNLWRVVTPSELTEGVPSWNLLHLPTYPTAEAALLSTGYFK